MALTRITVTINFAGDGVDSTSRLLIQMQYPFNHILGAWNYEHSNPGDYGQIIVNLNIADNNLPPSNVQGTFLYLQIDSNDGDDRCFGQPYATFAFDNGQSISATYQAFSIANFNGESNNTHQPVVGKMDIKATSSYRKKRKVKQARKRTPVTDKRKKVKA